MKRTILEYVATDRFFLLFLTARGMDNYKGDFRTVNHNRFDPDVVQEVQNDLGIPDSISCSNVDFNLNDEGEFHSPDFKTPSLKSSTIWLDWLNDQRPPRQHREEKPAYVRLNDCKLFHTHGRLTQVYLDRWEFKWYNHGKLFRKSGPFGVVGSPIHIMIMKNGALKPTNPVKAFFEWNHPGGGNIPEDSMIKAIKEHQIDVNRLDPGNGVFPNEMEEMIFYTSIDTK